MFFFRQPRGLFQYCQNLARSIHPEPQQIQNIPSKDNAIAPIIPHHFDIWQAQCIPHDDVNKIHRYAMSLFPEVRMYICHVKGRNIQFFENMSGYKCPICS